MTYFDAVPIDILKHIGAYVKHKEYKVDVEKFRHEIYADVANYTKEFIKIIITSNNVTKFETTILSFDVYEKMMDSIISNITNCKKFNNHLSDKLSIGLDSKLLYIDIRSKYDHTIHYFPYDKYKEIFLELCQKLTNLPELRRRSRYLNFAR